MKLKKNLTMKWIKVLVIILILIFLIVFFSCSYFLLKDYSELKENNESTENLIEDTIEVNPETQIVSIDWDYLKSVNEDIIGWLEIENTNISYPILKDNKLYYLKHSFDKKYNSNGSIFTTDTSPFIDLQTTIYGHNMKNGSMFSNLAKYLDKDFLYSHLKLKIYTPTCDYEGTIFSAYSIGVDTESKNIKSLDFNELVNYYKKASKYTIEINGEINKIVKLSTCSYINQKTTPTDQRYYIIAYLIPIE